MSKSNPTTRPDAPNYEVVGNMIHRYERMTIAEAFGVLSQVKNPLCGFRDANFQPWQDHLLDYVLPRAAEPFRAYDSTYRETIKFQQCARIIEEDPRKVPDGVPELPEHWLAYVGKGSHKMCGDAYWYLMDDQWRPHAGGSMYYKYAIDVRTAFARQHFPEYVESLGYPLSEPKPERIQLTDTQLLDKLAETEMKLENGSQLWQVFTDRDDPQMTLREAITAWGADE